MKKLFLLSLAIFLYGTVLSVSEAQFPVLTGPVVDMAGLLTPEQAGSLSQKSISYQKSKGCQIAICIVPTTAPLTIEDYGIQLAQKWKIGREKISDGIIIIIAKNDRKMRIEVGYGLEHAITDLRSGRIVDQIMAPEFRKGNFYKGIDSAVDSLIALINGGDVPALSLSSANIKSSSSAGSSGFGAGIALVIGSIIMFIVLFSKSKTALSVILSYFSLSGGIYLLGAGSILLAAVIGGISMLVLVIIAAMIKNAPSGSSSGYSSGSSYSSSSDSYSSSSGSDSYSGGGGDFGGGGSSGDW